MEERNSLEGFSIALIIHSLDPTRLAIINGLSFNPTYDSDSPKWSSIYSPRERRKALLLRGHKENRDLEKISMGFLSRSLSGHLIIRYPLS